MNRSNDHLLVAQVSPGGDPAGGEEGKLEERIRDIFDRCGIFSISLTGVIIFFEIFGRCYNCFQSGKINST